MSWDRWAPPLFWLAVLALPLVASEYRLTLFVYIGLSSIVGLGLVLLTGAAGLSSFGQAAYVGLGAYITAVLTVKYGVSPWLTLPLVIVLAMAGSFLGALLTVQLSGHYLPLATIAFAVTAYFLFGALTVTNGQNGIAEIPRLSIGSYELKRASHFYFVMMVLLLFAMRAIANLLDSRMGRAIRAIAGGSAMPESMGIDTRGAKTGAFVIACTLAAFVGWFYAHFQQFINPTPFSLNQGIEYLFMVVLGGAQSLWGVLLGAGLVTLLKQWLQQILPILISSTGNFEIVVFGVLVILLFHFAPEGIIPSLRARFGLDDFSPRAIPYAPTLGERAPAESGELLLSARDVSKSFGGLRANDGIDLDLHAGEILALIGPNGAGKSTFFALISGLLGLDAGSVRFRGEAISGKSARAISLLGLSRTFQHVRLVPSMSALENVALGAHRRGHTGMLRAMLRLDRTEEACLLAEAMLQLKRVGLEQYAWTPAGALALGQQRILEIARALAADPYVLLLDEPAAGLRSLEKDALAKLLGELRAGGLGILLVEHDMQFVMNLSDRVVVLDYGRKLAEGAPDDILADERVLNAYLGAA